MLPNIQVKFKKSIIETYKYLTDHLIFQMLVCPHCKAKGSMSIHAYYHRHVLAFLDNEIKHEVLRIMRLKCDSCGTTHAVLPDFIIPYCTFSHLLILECLKGYFHKQKVKDLCEQYDISFQLLYTWIKRFKDHQGRCILFFKQGRLTLKEILNIIIHSPDLSSFLMGYFLENMICFMQIIKPPS